ncbi:hypothetical protein DsansV1_C02g0013661 [Dioscorea sansibarensis]
MRRPLVLYHLVVCSLQKWGNFVAVQPEHITNNHTEHANVMNTVEE